MSEKPLFIQAEAVRAVFPEMRPGPWYMSSLEVEGEGPFAVVLDDFQSAYERTRESLEFLDLHSSHLLATTNGELASRDDGVCSVFARGTRVTLARLWARDPGAPGLGESGRIVAMGPKRPWAPMFVRLADLAEIDQRFDLMFEIEDRRSGRSTPRGTLTQFSDMPLVEPGPIEHLDELLEQARSTARSPV